MSARNPIPEEIRLAVVELAALCERHGITIDTTDCDGLVILYGGKDYDNQHERYGARVGEDFYRISAEGLK